MKKHSLFFALVAMSLAACSTKPTQPVVSETYDPTPVEEGAYTVQLINPNVWHIQDFNHDNPAGETFDEQGVNTHFNNCSDLYLLTGTESALLIDLSNLITWNDSAVTSLRRLVADRIGDLPLTITFTHNHGDHTGMFPAYANDSTVKFALPRLDFENLLQHFNDCQYSLYDEGYVFDLGGVKVNTILVPGHTKGSIVFHVVDQDLLLTGDAIGSGHGVWIFDTEGFKLYQQAVPHLLSYVTDQANGIDTTALRIYGGHYWQRDWMDPNHRYGHFPNLSKLDPKEELGMTYLRDMEQDVLNVTAGTAETMESGLSFKKLDTYFICKSAVIVWNGDEAKALAQQ